MVDGVSLILFLFAILLQYLNHSLQNNRKITALRKTISSKKQEEDTRTENVTRKAGSFKIDPVRPEVAAAAELEGGSGTPTSKKNKKGTRKRDLNPYRSLSRVRCTGERWRTASPPATRR